MVTVRNNKARQRPPRPRPVVVVPAPKAPSVRPIAVRKAVSVAKNSARRSRLIANASLALKKEKAKQNADPTHRMLQDPWVYVGNLDPELTERRLLKHFSKCGTVEQVTIRYSGSFVPASPEMCYRYAIVKFQTRSAAHAALQLNNAKAHGSKTPLVVEPRIINLPEVAYMDHMDIDELFAASARRRRCDVQSPKEFQTASGVASGLTSRVAMDKTKIWTPTPEAERKSRRAKGKSVVVNGISFKMTLA